MTPREGEGIRNGGAKGSPGRIHQVPRPVPLGTIERHQRSDMRIQMCSEWSTGPGPGEPGNNQRDGAALLVSLAHIIQPVCPTDPRLPGRYQGYGKLESLSYIFLCLRLPFICSLVVVVGGGGVGLQVSLVGSRGFWRVTWPFQAVDLLPDTMGGSCRS